MKYLFIFVIICSFFLKSNAQGELSEEQRALIRNEHTFTALLNSNGWGGGYAYGKMKNIHIKRIYSFELVSIKDKKEKKFTANPDYRRFVFGKENDLINIRFGFGNLHTLFDKKDKGGIEIRWFYQVGPVIGLVKPVYYYTQNETNTGANPIQLETFEELLSNSSDILGGTSYFRGFDEMTIVPGIFAKLGGSFEFSKKDLVINALECGVTFDLFPTEIEIMANNENKFYFLAIFIGYRFGQIHNPRAKKKVGKQ
jgi:hypothetical protein